MSTWLIVLVVVVVVAAVLVAVTARSRARQRRAAGGIGLPPVGALAAGEPVTGPGVARSSTSEEGSSSPEPTTHRS